jgi:hypothetical protein
MRILARISWVRPEIFAFFVGDMGLLDTVPVFFGVEKILYEKKFAALSKTDREV